jgi:hypothetical protein
MPVNPADRNFSDEDLISLFSTPRIIPILSAPAFLFDEDVDQGSIPHIEALGLLVSTVMGEGLGGESSDFQVLAHARSLGRTLVTSDKASRSLHRRLLDLNLGHAGIIYLGMKREAADLVAFIEEMYHQSVEKDIPTVLHHMWWKV